MVFKLFFIILIIIHTTSNHLILADNECGGDDATEFKWKKDSICETRAISCPFGIARCQDTNTMVCVPNCGVTLYDIMKSCPSTQVAIREERRNCLNGGYYTDKTASFCVCPQFYSGQWCEIVDPCNKIDCNGNGYCSNGACVCDILYSGNRCETRRDCNAYNLIWTGKECICQRGFEGQHCDQCSSKNLCVPLRSNPHEFTMITLSEPSLIDDLLLNDPPPGYSMKPYQPTLRSNCQCSTVSAAAISNVNFGKKLIANIAPNIPVQRTFSDDDDDSYSTYVHHYYQHHFRPRWHSEAMIIAMAATGIVAIILLGIVIYYCCHQPSDSNEKNHPNAVGPLYEPNPIYQQYYSQPTGLNYQGMTG